MKQLQQELKQGTIQRVYLLYGEEAYLRRQYEEKIKNACISDGDTMNFHVYDGKGVSADEIIDLAQTMPFFANKRLIVLRNSGFFKGGSDELVKYLAEVPDTACLLFVEEEVDKRTRLYKAVQKAGRTVEFKRQDTRTLTAWIASVLKKESKRITAQDVRLLLEKTGDDMEHIRQELEKLICYTYGRDVITAEDIEQICTMHVSSQIFEMIHAMAEKRQKTALDLYYSLLALREAPMRILALISRQFNLLMQVKDLARLGCGQKEIAARAGISPYFIGRYIVQSKGFTMEQLRSALEDCVQAEENVKMGKMPDKLCVELLIVMYSKA